LITAASNRWPAAHVLDTARLYKLAVEKAEPGATYHAVAEEGISLKQIAEVLGRKMQIPTVSIAPEDAAGHFGWLAAFAGTDAPASSAKTHTRTSTPCSIGSKPIPRSTEIAFS